MYCGKEHQVQHWPSHKAFCIAPSQPTSTSNPNTGYIIKESGIGGPGDMGIFATRDFEIGDLLLAEKPVFILPNVSLGATNLLDHEYSKLSAADKARFDALSNAFPQRGRYGIFTTNAMPLGDTTGSVKAHHGGIFLLISRINHSCCPNVLHSWCQATNEERIYAIKQIKAGEQIFTSYLDDLFNTYEQRKELLQASWKFSCQCSACLPENRAKSDANRKRLADLYEAFPSMGRNPVKAKNAANEMMKLIESEGQTEARFGPICYEAYQILIANRGNEAAAKAFISKAYRGYLLSRGPEEETTTRMKGYYQNPQSHYAAGML
jgi:hypothetical protein